MNRSEKPTEVEERLAWQKAQDERPTMSEPGKHAKNAVALWISMGLMPDDPASKLIYESRFQVAIDAAAAELRESLDVAEASWKQARLDAALASSQCAALRAENEERRLRMAELNLATGQMHERAKKAEAENERQKFIEIQRDKATRTVDITKAALREQEQRNQDLLGIRNELQRKLTETEAQRDKLAAEMEHLKGESYSMEFHNLKARADRAEALLASWSKANDQYQPSYITALEQRDRAEAACSHALTAKNQAEATASKLAAELKDWEAERDRAEAAAAHRLRALHILESRRGDLSGEEFEIVQRAMQTDAGRDWVPLDLFRSAMLLIEKIPTVDGDSSAVVAAAENFLAKHGDKLKT